MRNLTKEGRLALARHLLNKTNCQMGDMQTIVHGGWIMDINSFRLMLNNNDHMKNRWDDLRGRKFKLERMIWKLT
jgi:hypothetical protein